MIPPNKQHLQALAGWAISADTPLCSDRQSNCLHRFKDSCAELAQVVEDLPTPSARPRHSANKAPAKKHPLPEPVVQPFIPQSVQKVLSIDQKGECDHKFDIKTQHCRYCGMSYRAARGRDPELF